MKNILKIILHDCNQILTNVVALVVVIGLAILPSLYAWFNINSNWDPYSEEATGNLKIAVFSNDKGMKVKDYQVCIGDSVVSALENNKTIGWVFTEDERRAINGVYSGDYYAALIIPENFTEDIAAILDGDTSGGTIKYYSNEKKNAIATKITSKAKSAVETQVNAEVFGTITKVAVQLGDALKKMDESDGVLTGSNDALNLLEKEINKNIRMVESMEQAAESGSQTLSTLSALTPKMVKDIQEDLTQLSGSTTILTNVQTMTVRLEDYISLLSEGKEDLASTKEMLLDMKKMIKQSKQKVKDTSENEEVKNFVSILENEPEKVGEYFSSFVNLKNCPVYKTENYGSAMASFYTVLAIWVGSLILVAILHTKVKPIANVRDLKPWEAYFGRFFIFLLIGQIQTLICVLGDICFLRIQCVHPFLFWLGAAMTSFTFTILIYSLTFAFGNIGEALAVVIMVLQVAGAGGTFPMEVLPEFFRKLYNFMPFTYCMKALKECVSGMYANDFWIAILKMFAFVAASLFIGLILRIPFVGLNELIEKSKEKSDLMV